MSETEETFPVKPGDWVVDKCVPDRVAIVKQVYRDSCGVCVDLYLYDHEGDRMMRQSPHMGGPRTFEPACDYANYQRIEKPQFPITLKWRSLGDGVKRAEYHHCGEVLPDRQWKRPERKPRQLPMPVRTDYDPRMEAAARRMAAQELRDTGRKLNLPELAKRAEELEAEAKRIEGDQS